MGERRVSSSRLARTLNLVRWYQMDSFFGAILGSRLHNYSSSSYYSSILPYWSDYHPIPSRSFWPHLALPMAAFFTDMAKRKVTAKKLLAWTESNDYKKRAYREKDSTRDDKDT